MKKIYNIIFSYVTTSVLFLTFAFSIAYATFIENDFDTKTALALVYNAWWFELLLSVLVLHLMGSIFYHKLFKSKKWAVLMFHLSFIFIFVGSALTRYYSYEGMMHIREGKSSNSIKTIDPYLKLRIIENDSTIIESSRLVLSPNVYVNFDKTYSINDNNISITGLDYYIKAIEAAIPSSNGEQIISLLVEDKSGSKKRIFLKDGTYTKVGDLSFGFNSNKLPDVRFYVENDSVYVDTDVVTTFFNMYKRSIELDTLIEKTIVSKNDLFTCEGVRFNLKSYTPKGEIKVFKMDGKEYQMHQITFDGLDIVVTVNGETQKLTLLKSPNGLGQEKYLSIGGVEMFMSYGKSIIELPFEIELRNFELERYVGSNNPSSFKSYVTINDEVNGEKFDYEIFMNNILDYNGYRFFQSSYDKDEKGTILSVNYDLPGTTITYIGYFFMMLGMSLAMFSKKSRLMFLLNRISKRASKSGLLVVIMFSFALSHSSIQAQSHFKKEFVLAEIDNEAADNFGELLVVDLKGRLKPINTLSSEILRKVARSNSFMGLGASQVILDMMLNPENWGNAPMIKISSKKLKRILLTDKSKVSYNHIVSMKSTSGENLIYKYALVANNKPASDRDSFDKDVLKVNERVNIYYMILTSEIFKIFPDVDCKTCEWKSIKTILEGGDSEPKKMLSAIIAGNTNYDWVSIDENITKLHNYQQKYSNVELPSPLRIKSELIYNQLNLFPKLAISYFILGFVLMVLLFISVLNSNLKFVSINKVLKTLLYLTFAAHVFAFAIRWYIAGYAPLSNGYETILFIAIITMLTGIVLSTKSQITYAVSAILASILLLVASLSYFDPEITNQAPVLKSVWLVIHVAIITMSYGFFGISAILGLFNLFIYLFINKKNFKSLSYTLDELSDIIEITIIIGLYLLAIGTFLGAIWANESWGRYWGWDPKETWALVTVLVYATFVHLRFTKYLKGSFAISISAVFMISSVLMTYFGVNYFLSGLHSYAGDGPSIVPIWVYYAVIGVAVIALLSYLKKLKLETV